MAVGLRDPVVFDLKAVGSAPVIVRGTCGRAGADRKRDASGKDAQAGPPYGGPQIRVHQVSCSLKNCTSGSKEVALARVA